MFRNMLKRLTKQRFAAYIGLLLAKAIGATYRIRVLNPEAEQNILKKGQVPIYASWHQRFFPGIIFMLPRRPISIMISQSRDGELIATIASVLGYHPIRGSSSQGGKQALREISKLARQGCKIGHIVDGPRGPLGVVKPGLLVIAQVSGMPILPSISSSEKKWVFNSWDRFMVPKPFSRIIIRFGDEIYVPKKLHGPDFERQRSAIEQTMKELYLETDLLWTKAAKIDLLFKH